MFGLYKDGSMTRARARVAWFSSSEILDTFHARHGLGLGSKWEVMGASGPNLERHATCYSVTSRQEMSVMSRVGSATI
jgi:hypothetical protein